MRYFLVQIGKTNRIVAGYDGDHLQKADEHYVENTELDFVADWVNEIGHFVHTLDPETLDLFVLIDKTFEVPNTTDYDVAEYKRYHAVLMRLLHELVK